MTEAKYKNKKVVIDGIAFDSKDEAEYYKTLLALRERGVVRAFERQKRFVLQPKFKTATGETVREIGYVVDFVVDYGDLKVAVDVKGMSTQQGELRRKMFLYRFPDVPLRWVARSKKYGNEFGWIDYDKLQKIRRDKKNGRVG